MKDFMSIFSLVMIVIVSCNTNGQEGEYNENLKAYFSENLNYGIKIFKEIEYIEKSKFINSELFINMEDASSSNEAKDFRTISINDNKKFSEFVEGYFKNRNADGSTILDRGEMIINSEKRKWVKTKKSSGDIYIFSITCFYQLNDDSYAVTISDTDYERFLRNQDLHDEIFQSFHLLK